MNWIAPLSRKSWRTASVMALTGALAGIFTFSGTVTGHPSTDTTLTYEFTNCSGPAGTPEAFAAVKQPGSAAALHLGDGGGIFVAVAATHSPRRAALVSTPRLP